MDMVKKGNADVSTCRAAIADGAGVQFEDILAMNVRSEISMGMMNDGCTALYWSSESASLLAQNWDVRLYLLPIFCYV
jgi:hypothetical protein